MKISDLNFRALRRWIAPLAALTLALPLLAEDWPQWRGKDRRGVWAETGILDGFGDAALDVSWRVPLAQGYSGPAVADGRVFITDLVPKQGRSGIERVHSLDEKTGKTLWTHEYEVDYAGLQYDSGPRATPTVDGERVYTLGAMGDLLAFEAKTGKLLWKRQYMTEFKAPLPTWGFVGAPLVDGDQLICLVGGQPDAKVVSLDKMTGKERWRAISGESEPGYDPPIIIEAGGTRQLIIWHPVALTSLDPTNGKVFWEHPFSVQAGLTVATPVLSGDRLLISSFYNGSRMFRLAADRPEAELMWKGSSNSEIETDGLHSLVTTPLIIGDYIYGIGSYGQFRCIDARTGKRVWETMDVTIENERWASGQIVQNGDRVFINNDRGDLIIAKLSPEGYEEIDRVSIMKPTNPTRRRRAKNAVHWTHPAYANRHLIIRNDEELVRFSLAAK